MKKKKALPTKTRLTISVLLPVYYGTNPAFLAVALSSIIEQTVTVDELIIVYDGPVSLEIERCIEKTIPDNFKSKIKYVKYETNRGLGHALNKGVKASSCDFILRMDDDDYSVPNRVKLQLAAINSNPDIDVVGGQIIEFNPNSSPNLRPVPCSHREIYKKFGLRNTMNHVTVAIRRKALLAAGNYEPLSRFGFEDYELWSRMLAKGFRFLNIKEPLVFVRFDQSQLSRRGGIKYFKEELKVIYNFYKLGLINTCTFLAALAARSLSRFLPNSILALFYKHFLRGRLPKEMENEFSKTLRMLCVLYK